MKKFNRILQLLLGWFLVILTSPVLIIFALVAFIHRISVTCILAKIFHPEYEPVKGLDAGFSLDYFWVQPRGAIAFVHKMKGKVDPDDIKERLSKVLQKYPRLTCIYPKVWLTYPFWVKSSPFKIENHIRLATNLENEDLTVIVKNWLQSSFAYECQLWDVLIIPDCKEEKSLFGFRIHHAVGDGYSMLQFLEKVFDAKEIPSRGESTRVAATGKPVIRPLSLREMLLTELHLTLWTPFIMLQFTRDFFFHQDLFMMKKFTSKIVLATCTVALEDLKKIRKKVGSHVSLNTIILHLFGGALRQYLIKAQTRDSSSLPIETIVVCSLPVHQQEHPVGEFCNHWSHGTFRIPIKEPNREKRLSILASNVSDVLELHMQKVYSRFAKVVAFLPVFILRQLLNHNVSASMGMANLPGPPNPIYLQGRKVLRKLAVVGIQWKHASIMLSAVSYNGEFTLCMTANQEVVPTDEIAAQILNEFFIEELRAELENDLIL